MKFVVLGGALSLIFGTLGIATVPGPAALGSSLTILKENDLYAQYSNKTSSAILIERPKTFASAKSACSCLSEKLWSPEDQKFTAGLNNSLSYQSYLRKFSYSQQFWVADYDDKNPKTKDTCRAIDLAGKVRVLSCDRLLPSLCTHSAPMTNETFWDTSKPYQVSVKTGKQTVTGFRDSLGFRFMGLRFAPKPARFQHSTVYEGTGTVEAFKYGSWCVQLHDGQVIGSEDCLFLNIATPYLPGSGAKKQDLKPVFFWIHGGGFWENSGDLGHSDGINVASRGDIVVIKMNHRVGHTGWLAINGTSITGNYGLGDMITALKWAKKNIEAFGGDPARITIGGDSSGAAAVRALMTSEAANGLFSAGIAESLPIGYNPVNFFSQYLSILEYTGLIGAGVIQGSNCSTAADVQTCLKTVDAGALNSIDTPVGHLSYPVVDNILLKTSIMPVTGKGYAANVPLLTGMQRDETGIQLSPYYGLTANASEFIILAGQTIGADFTPLANHPDFPVPSGDPYRAAFNVTQRILTDVGYKCLTWATAYSAAKHKVLPAVYAYETNRTYQAKFYTNPVCEPPITAEHPFGDPDAEYFKCHSGEVNLVFGEQLFISRPIRDENDIPYQQLIVDYWTSFVREHDPNPKPGYLKARGYWETLNQVSKTGKWEKVSASRPKSRWLDWNGYMVDFSERKQCETLGLGLDYFEKLL